MTSLKPHFVGQKQRSNELFLIVALALPFGVVFVVVVVVVVLQPMKLD